MSIDLAPCLRASLKAAAPIASQLGVWNGDPAIYTRRPVPGDAPAPFVLINPDAAITDQDGTNAPRPIIQRDILIVGNQPKDYRVVEALGYTMREHFHRKPQSIIAPEGYHCVLIIVSGPTPAPVDDPTQVARAIHLTVWLSKLPA